MTGRICLAVVAILAAACTSSTEATTTTFDLIPTPPSPRGDTTTIPPGSTTTSPRGPFIEPILGYLPDGTDYTVYLETGSPERLISIEANILYESEGAIWDIGELTFVAGEPPVGGPFVGEFFVITAGDEWTALLKPYEEFLELLGPEAVEILSTGIQGVEYLAGEKPFPGLALSPPFRWATQHDPTPPMEVRYETIAIQHGCSLEALTCTEYGTLQVVERANYEAHAVRIGSDTPRSKADPFYLDPGPLSRRESPDVIWTGVEMIVWGGQRSGRGPRIDGAAFDPATDGWRILEGPPLGETTLSRAVWAGDAMLVITPVATYSGDPVLDEWVEVGLGYRLQPDDPIVVIGDDLYVWADGGIAHMSPDFTWDELPDPGFGDVDPWQGTLHDFGGNLVATGLFNRRCESRRTSIWTGAEWVELDSVSFNSCSTANQSAVVAGELVLWSDGRDPTYRYDAGSLTWARDESIPMSGSDGPSGPLIMENRAFVPGFGEGAIYDPSSRAWFQVSPPGFAYSTQMVWTGTEVLAWIGTNGPFGDAWRWTPPVTP